MILYHQHIYTNSALLQRRILVLVNMLVLKMMSTSFENSCAPETRSPLRYSETYFPMNTATMIAEIATEIATRMTITLRRDLGGRMAAVNRSLLPVMESCSPGFAGSRWIWSKEIVSFSDDAISDEISRHGCRIYFTLKMLRKKLLVWKNHQADDSLHSKL